MSEQEELLKKQKENCIFCRINAGEMPAKKVYEDERMLAILDIRPAAKGHTLVLPREHYPIMPLLPPEEFTHLFGRTAALTKAIKEATLSQRATVFIANGPVAGQQSPHFLFHVIPREEGDGLFTIPDKGVNQSDIEPLLKTNLFSVMREHLMKVNRLHLLQMGEAISDEEAAMAERRSAAMDAASARTQEVPVAPQAPPAQAPSPQQLAQIIEQNPDIKQLLLERPDELERIVREKPEFQQLFAGVDIAKLSAFLKSGGQMQAARPEQAPATQPPAQPAPPTQQRMTPRDAPGEEASTEDIKPAAQMTMQELFAYIESKPKLKAYLLQAPEKLKELIPQHPRLSKFFEGANVDAIISAYRAHEEGSAGETTERTMEGGS